MDETSMGLSDALTSLQELLLTAPEVESFLHEVAVLASRLVEPAASVGITVHYRGEALTVASSDDRAAMIDEEQYGLGQGPCLEAISTGELVEVKDQSTDARWGGYSAKARAYGVRSSLSLPLFVDGRAMGALNLYSAQRSDAFGGEVTEQARAFAERASIALTLTIRYDEQARTARQLTQALHARALIDQAIGILMAEQRCDAHAAFELLRRHSQTHNRKLREVAVEVITRVSGHPPVAPAPFEPGQRR
jgi:GAF domain-containing protein